MFGKVSLPGKPVIADRPPGGRDVTGSQPFECGWIGRQAGWGEKARRMQAAQRQLEISDNEIAKARQKMQDDILQLEFLERTERRRLQTDMRAKVESGLRAAEKALESRRDRLRNLLQTEDSALTAEYVERAMRADGDKLEEMRQRVAQNRARKQSEERQMVEKKRLQQYRLRMDILRDNRSKLLAKEAVKAQLCQMEERQRLHEQQREEDRFWDEVMRKEVQAKMAREEQEAREKADRDREMKETLEKQLAGQAKLREEQEKIRQEQMLHNERMLEELRLEQRGLAEELERRRSQLADELREQIAVRQRFLDEAKHQEDLIDETFARLTEEALRREKAAQLDLSSALRREQQLFRENLEEMRRKKIEEERELNRMLDEEQEKLRKKQDEMRIKARNARQQLLEGVLNERAQQVEQRRQERQLQAEQAQKERELAEQLRLGNEALHKEHMRRKAELQQQYGIELLQQAEMAHKLREAERAEVERQWHEGLMAEEAYLRKMEELLALGTVEDYPPHPFLSVVEGQADQSPPQSPGPLNQRWGADGPPYPPGAAEVIETAVGAAGDAHGPKSEPADKGGASELTAAGRHAGCLYCGGLSGCHCTHN